jgi:hypothetical protein
MHFRVNAFLLILLLWFSPFSYSSSSEPAYSDDRVAGPSSGQQRPPPLQVDAIRYGYLQLGTRVSSALRSQIGALDVLQHLREETVQFMASAVEVSSH